MLPEQFKLSNGTEIPSVGLGTWQLEGEQGYEAIKYAVKSGYKMIDCAYNYFNQELVGRAIRDSSVDRSELYIVDKLAQTWHTHANECLDATLKSLQLDYLDLWLMHWPTSLNHNGNDKKTPKLEDGSIDFEKDWDYVKTWKSMIDIQNNNKGKVKAIGVANFGIKELTKILEETGVPPVVNQVELHPSCNQQQLFEFCEKIGTKLVAYSPLGSIGSPLMKNEDLAAIAEGKGVNVSQCLLSWGVYQGWPVIPRSSNFGRIDENLKLVELSKEDYEKITEIGQQNAKRFIMAPWHTFE